MADRSPIDHPEEWSSISLDDITSKIGSGATPRGGEKTYLDKRVRFALIRSQNVFDRHFDPTGLAFISDSQADGLRGVHLQSGDILLNITGDGCTFGRSCIVPDSVLPACVNQHVSIIRVNPELAEPGYVLAFLTHPLTKEYIESFNSGGSRRAITKGHIQSFCLGMPSIAVQQRIADVLGKLDDRIELNRRMNRTLEKMAAAIFKSWFVDFDPVRAKAEGRDPGLPADIANLFPDALEDSELGEIPAGWQSGPLSELASLQTKTIQPRNEPEVRWEHYSIPAYDDGQQPRRELGETIKSGKYMVPEKAVLVSKLNPQFPRIWLPWVYDAALAICSTEFMPFVAAHSKWRPFIYEMMKSNPIQDAIKAHVGGSTGSRQRVKPKEIAILDILLPPENLIDAFSGVVAPLHQRLLLNRRQNRRLAGLRDTLLPKLLSGEVEVPELDSVEQEIQE